jgi:hypothetical protein
MSRTQHPSNTPRLDDQQRPRTGMHSIPAQSVDLAAVVTDTTDPPGDAKPCLGVGGWRLGFVDWAIASSDSRTQASGFQGFRGAGRVQRW